MGSGHCRLLIANWCLRLRPIENRQLRIGNPLAPPATESVETRLLIHPNLQVGEQVALYSAEPFQWFFTMNLTKEFLNVYTFLLTVSVSHSDVGRVARYVTNQEEHHRERTY